VQQMKCPHCGKKTTEVELAAYSGHCIHCRNLPAVATTRVPEGMPRPAAQDLPQRHLVRLSCVRCRQAIASNAEGRFCESCGNPVHNPCLASGPPSLADG
jgi:hypothetical protein